MGTRFPLFVCRVHDEMYYQPIESEIDDSMALPFVVEVSVSGSLHSGRRPYKRVRLIDGWAMLP
jgi:hypothetical protein